MTPVPLPPTAGECDPAQATSTAPVRATLSGENSAANCPCISLGSIPVARLAASISFRSRGHEATSPPATPGSGEAERPSVPSATSTGR